MNEGRNGMCADLCTLTCFYCDERLDAKHEHDHYPIAKRHGGTDCVPICRACHNLKDRIPLDHWPAEMALQAFMQAGPLGRILIAKVTGMFADAEAVANEVDAA